MASNSVFTAEKTEIGEIESFSVRRTGWDTWDASLPWESLADCVQVLTQAYAMPPGSIARGSVYQVQNIYDNYRPQSILQWLDTQDRTYVLSLYYDELPTLTAVLADLADDNDEALDLDLSKLTRIKPGNRFDLQLANAVKDEDTKFSKAVGEAASGSAPVQSVNEQTGDIVLGPEDVGAAPESVVGDVSTLNALTATGRLSEVSLEISSLSTAVTAGLDPANYYHSSRVNTLAISSSNGTLVNNATLNRGYALPVVPGEIYSISRDSLVNPVFRVAFTSVPPAVGVQTFSELRQDTSLKIEGVTVPATATYMVLSLTGTGSALPNIKIEKGRKATAIKPTDADYGIGLMNLFPKLSTDLDDTERIQRALNYCALKGIPFSAAGDKAYTGQYLLREVKIPSGLTAMDFAGAYLKRPNLKVAPYNMTVEQRKWVRMLVVNYVSDTDMRLLTISNATLDGNARENWSDPLVPSYEQEQASLIIIGASSTKAGKANVDVKNVLTLDCTSDGVHVVANANVNITSLHSKGCFRGGLTVTGGRSVVMGSDLILETPTVGMRDGIDIEVDGPGFGGVWATHVDLKGVVMDDDLDISAGIGSTIIIDGLVMRGTGWNIGASQGTVSISNSVLRRGTGNDRLLIRNGGSVTLTNVTLHAPAGLATVPVQQFAIPDSTERGLVRFRDCIWVSGSDGVASNLSNFADIEFLGGRFMTALTGAAIGGTFSGTNFAPRSVLINGTVFENPGYWLRHTGIPMSGGGVVRVATIFVNNPANLGMSLYSPAIVWLNSPAFEYGFQVTVLPGGAPTYKGTRVDLTV